MVARRTGPDLGSGGRMRREVCGMKIGTSNTWEDLENTQMLSQVLGLNSYFWVVGWFLRGKCSNIFLLETIFGSLFLGVPKNTARVVVESEAKIGIFDNRRFLKILVVNDHNLQVELWNCRLSIMAASSLKSKFHSDLGINRRCTVSQ